MEEMDENSNKKEWLFSFDRINKYYLFPFLAPIFCMLANFFLGLVRNKISDKVNNYEFLLSMFINFSYIFGGLIYFISFIRTKTEETKEHAIIHKNKNSLNLIYNKGLKKDKKIIFGILFLMSILLSIYIMCISFSFRRTVFDKRIFYLFFISIFSRFILKSKIYKHQILSLSLSFIGLIILFLPFLSKINNDDIPINIFNIFSAAFYSLFLVLIKYITYSYFLSPYLCLLLVGFFSLIITLIGFILYSLIKNNDLSYIMPKFDSIQNQLGITYYLYTFLSFLFCSLLQIFSFLVVYYFSPLLLVVTDIISPMLSWALGNIIETESYHDLFFNSIGYFIELIAAFIYNEIIICNFCDFNKYTKKCIEERQNKELNSLKMDENDNDTSYNSDVE